MQENNQNGMTRLMFEHAVKERLTLNEAKRELQTETYIRTVNEVLAHYFGVKQEELQAAVTNLLYESSVEGTKRDSIAHKVRDWLKKKTISIDRESVIQLAFALKLDIIEAEEMLCRLSNESFHRRDPKDIVYIFAMEHQMTYVEALNLLDRMLPLYEANKSPAQNQDIEKIKQRIDQIQDNEDLKNFLINEALKLGVQFSLRDNQTAKHDNTYIINELCKYCRVSDESKLSKKLNDLLCKSSGAYLEEDVDRIRDKVDSWLRKKKTSIDRDSVLQLAFALNLNLTDTEEMLCSLCGDGFDLGNPEDIIWRYALKHKLTYTEASALRSQMPRLTMTENVKVQIDQIQTEDDLMNFFVTESAKLGEMHNTAYDLFLQFMERLSDKGNIPIVGEKISGNILDNYFHRDIIPTHQHERRALEDALQRNIKKNWPDEFTLSKMKQRHIDVTRKVLILLFLASYEENEDDYDFYEENNVDGNHDKKTLFEDTYLRLSFMLKKCGFSPIDSRNPFDWMVLYCLASSEEFYDIDENIRDFLREIFNISEDKEEEKSGDEG